MLRKHFTTTTQHTGTAVYMFPLLTYRSKVSFRLIISSPAYLGCILTNVCHNGMEGLLLTTSRERCHGVTVVVGGGYANNGYPLYCILYWFRGFRVLWYRYRAIMKRAFSDLKIYTEAIEILISNGLSTINKAPEYYYPTKDTCNSGRYVVWKNSSFPITLTRMWPMINSHTS